MIDQKVYDLTQTGDEVQDILDKGQALPSNHELQQALAGKQDKLTFDNVPTPGSDNAITSGAVYDATTEEYEGPVTELPDASAETLRKIYLVGEEGATTYDRYYTSFDGTTYSWVPMGSTQINISGKTDKLGSGHANNVATFNNDGNLKDSGIAVADVESSIVYDISRANAVGDVLAEYADLSAALGVDGANIPEDLRRGGMSVKFVQSSDNKYVQYRLMTTTWSTTITDWQGVDDEPTAGSENLVKSGGIVTYVGELEDKIFKDKAFEFDNDISVASPALNTTILTANVPNGTRFTLRLSSDQGLFNKAAVYAMYEGGSIILLGSAHLNTDYQLTASEDYTGFSIYVKNGDVLASGVLNTKVSYVIENENTIEGRLDSVEGDIEAIEPRLMKYISTVPSSSSSQYTDLNDLPVNSVICYVRGLNYATPLPSDNITSGNVITINAYSTSSMIGAVQYLITDTGYLYSRTAWGAGATWTAWANIITDGIRRIKKLITGTISSDSDLYPYIDLNTAPVNIFACYSNPTNELLHTPPETGKNFNLFAYTAHGTTAITQLVTYQNGHVYCRTAWGGTKVWSDWARLDNTSDSNNEYSYHTVNIPKIIIDNTKTVIFSGDSITHGATSYIDPDTHQPATTETGGYPAIIQQITGCTSVNVGVNRSSYSGSGDSTTILAKLETVQLDCDYLFIAAGRNDYAVTQCTAAAFKSALASTFDYVDQHCTGEVVIMLPINEVRTAANTEGLKISDYREMLYEEAIRRDYAVIDCSKFFPSGSSDWQKEVMADTVHPTALGYKMYAKSILTEINNG